MAETKPKAEKKPKKGATRTFDATVAGAKVRGKVLIDRDEITVKDGRIVLTLHLATSHRNIKLVEFFNGAKAQKSVGVTIVSPQLELVEG